jgi:DNA polymerase I-like protein with 3'-5' exonuclease and polymerase domains
MKLLTLDFETYYDREYSLSKMTTEEYIRDERFEVIGLSMKHDDWPEQWFPKPMVKGILKTVDWANTIVVAQNTMFDGAILSWRYGVNPKAWVDIMGMSRALYPHEKSHSLKAQAERMGVGQKGTAVHDFIGKHYADFSHGELETYGLYCNNDVELTYDLFMKYMSTGFPRKELEFMDALLRMYINPVLRLDREVLEQHLAETVERKQELLHKVLLSSDADSLEEAKARLMSNEQFAQMLLSLGVQPPVKNSPTTGKQTWAFAKTDAGFMALLEDEDVRVQALVSARLGNRSTLEETRTERFIDIAKRGTLPMPIRYYAAHTGRGGGLDAINVQNLPARGANAGKLKKAILPPEDYVFIDCDSSQIEARCLAWTAGQDDLVEAFAKKQDVYKKMASDIYHAPVHEINTSQRFVGKATVLGCFGPDTRVLTAEGWKRIVEVQPTDMLWDGEEWVSHQGLVPKGLRNTIRAWGIDATPEHEILTEHGWREWHEVATNRTLFQSALSKVSLPSSVGSSTTNQPDVLRGGTLSSGALVDGKGKLIATTSRLGAQPDVTPVQKARQQLLGKSIGGMKTYSQIWNIVRGYSTELQVSLHAATQRLAIYTLPMVGVGSLCMSRGVPTARRSCATYLHSHTGTSLRAKSIGSTTTKDTNPATYDLQRGRKTPAINVKSGVCSKNLMTYDIAYAGPRNRFTIASTAGPIIVHNCGYGMGHTKFQIHLKTSGVELPIEECQRIITVYRQSVPNIVTLWKHAQEALLALHQGRSLRFGRDGFFLVEPGKGIRLPNGLHIQYPDLTTREADGKTEFVYKSKGEWVRIYGPKVIENLTQAVARLVVSEQLLRIRRRYPPVLTVHDAVGVVAPTEQTAEARAYVEECMSWVPSWAPGLPLACESGVGASYGDC